MSKAELHGHRSMVKQIVVNNFLLNKPDAVDFSLFVLAGQEHFPFFPGGAVSAAMSRLTNS